jgi:predicted transcriptional regulator
MSKITFRADEDLVERLEAFDASKSEVMREALRAYLEDAEGGTSDAGDEATVDDALAERVDELIAERLDRTLGAAGPGRAPSAAAPDVNVNVTLDGAAAESGEATVESASDADGETTSRKTDGANGDGRAETRRKTCGQCGEEMDGEHVYCPNCGEKASHRVFCDCGDELRSDWAFCPGCGRRTPAADVLERP